jgi:hypothetical protein
VTIFKRWLKYLLNLDMKLKSSWHYRYFTDKLLRRKYFKTEFKFSQFEFSSIPLMGSTVQLQSDKSECLQMPTNTRTVRHQRLTSKKYFSSGLVHMSV